MEEDPFTMVWEGPFLEGSMRVSALERALVPVDRDDAAISGNMRILVPRSYVEEALRAMDGGLVPDSPAELYPRSDELVDSPWRRMFLVAVAALVLLAMVVLALRSF